MTKPQKSGNTKVRIIHVGRRRKEKKEVLGNPKCQGSQSLGGSGDTLGRKRSEHEKESWFITQTSCDWSLRMTNTESPGLT